MNEGRELVIIRKSYTPEEYPPIVEVCGDQIRQLSVAELHFLRKVLNDISDKIVDEVIDD